MYLSISINIQRNNTLFTISTWTPVIENKTFIHIHYLIDFLGETITAATILGMLDFLQFLV